MSNDPRKLIYNIASTLDGFITGPDQALDFFSFTGDHVADYMASLRTYGAVIMGRRTYELGLKSGVTDPYPSLDTYVLSRNARESPSPRVRWVHEDAVEFVRALKGQAGADIYLCGGGVLASTLFAADLIDEVVIKLNPVLVGSGTPLIAALARPQALSLSSTKVYQGGVVTLRYLVTRA